MSSANAAVMGVDLRSLTHRASAALSNELNVVAVLTKGAKCVSR
jgi:hypothetical protein